LSGDKKDEILAKNVSINVIIELRKEFVLNVNHDDKKGFNFGLWELVDALHGIEGMKSLNCVIAD
jgi:hypothetical protein